MNLLFIFEIPAIIYKCINTPIQVIMELLLVAIKLIEFNNNSIFCHC